VSPCAPGCGNEGDCAGAGHNELVNLTKARVKLPRAVYGFAQRTAQIWLTDEEPYDFFAESKTGPVPYHGTNASTLTFADLEDPSVTEVLVTLPDEEAPYRPCFSFIATDARGDQAVAQLCLDTLFPMATNSDEPNTSGAGGSHDGVGDDVKQPSSRTSTGCSVGTDGAGGSKWLFAVGAFALIRKRSRRSATLGA
jgi:MYXO-CTERM domain-containing protein